VLAYPTLLVGYGRMGQLLAAAIRDHVPALDIVGVVDTRQDLDTLLDRDFDGSMDAFLDIVSAVAATGARDCIVSSPTSMHAGHVRDAIAASLDVFCEKPLTLDPMSSNDLGCYALSADRILQVGFYRRFSPSWIAARDLLRSGRIGRPSYIRATSFDSWMPPLAFADPAVSGGLAIDNGVHEFDSLSWLLDSPIASVLAHKGPDYAGELSSVGDHACAVVSLKFESGTLATVELTRSIGAVSKTELEIVGSTGRLRIDVNNNEGSRLVLTTALETGIVPGSESSNYWMDGIRAELETFASQVETRSFTGPSAEDSAAAVKAGLAVNEQLRAPEF
jgi:myo-inositol 2-dehydrogenase/D-chiro-inositol 1-dehydrogenase